MAASEMATIVLFGDSLTQEGVQTGGWGQRLAEEYIRRADVLFRGYSGYNSRWALELLDHLHAGERPALATVFFGANDAGEDEAQHVPVDEFERNITEIVRRLEADLGCGNVVIMTPPPIAEEAYIQAFLLPKSKENGSDPATLKADRSTERVRPYVEACKRVGNAVGAPVADVFTAVLEQAKAEGGELSSFFRDGLHFSAKGNGVAFETLQSTIRTLLPALAVTADPATGNIAGAESKCEALAVHAPQWKAIDPKAPTGSFLAAHFGEEPPTKVRKVATNNKE